MRFRRFIITAFILATLILAWPLICTWKIYQLENAYINAQEGPIDRNDMAKKLNERYGEAGEPIWSLPWGAYYYNDITRVALDRGQDLVGGSATIFQVDERAFILKYGDREKIMPIIQAVDKEKIPLGDSYLTSFIKQNQSNSENYCPLADLFSALDKVESTDQDKTVAEKLRDYMHDRLAKCSPTLEKHLGNTYHIRSQTTGQTKSLILESPDSSKKEMEKLANLADKPLELQFYEVVSPKDFYDTIKDIEEYTNDLSMPEYNKIKFTNLSKKKEALKVFQDKCRIDQRVFFGPKEEEKDGTPYYRIYLLKEDQAYNRKTFVVESAKAFTPAAPQEKHVAVKLDKSSGALLKELTAGLKDKAENTLLAIVLDEVVLTAPKLKSAIGQNFSIEFPTNASAKEVEKLADELNAGSLPIKLQKIETNVMGPSLGLKAQRQGFMAIFLGLILILLFMFCYYAKAGLLANVALIFNLLFILGTLAFCGFELTLSAIAAVVLTMGTAVDLNVVCFERIREERRAGILMRDAIYNGYEKAMRAIMDSNITTLVTGLILYSFGIGTIKSFAATLIIGIICTFVTAMLFSQLLFDLILYLVGPKRISFSFGFTENVLTNFKFDFISKRKLAYAFSAIVLLGGAGLTYYQGLDYGTEFTGGTDYRVSFGKKVDFEKVQTELKKEFAAAKTAHNLPKDGTVEVRQIGAGKQLTITTNFGTINKLEGDLTLDGLVQAAIDKSTNSKMQTDDASTLAQDEYSIGSKSTVDATMAKAIKDRAFWAILLALIAMLCYIFFSFNNIKLAFAALIALVHDVGALFACLALAKLFGVNYKITQGFITCTLTLIGYSINDTVIIFCRIREEKKNRAGRGIGDKESLNKSISLTLSRTIVTSITTFLPVMVLYFTGGIALEPMAFALGCGIIFGTYSSIFIATPIAYDMDKTSNFITKKVNRSRVQ
ncbi:MAG: protein translocase subunit SecF [Bacteroidota bacterium]